MNQLISSVQNDYPLVITVGELVVAILLTWIVSHYLTRILRKILRRDEVALPSSSIFINIVRAFVWLAGFSFALKLCFGFDAAGFIGALGIGGIALSLGFQDTLSNLIGGLSVSLGSIIAPGDYIRIGTLSGKVRDVTWRHTSIENVTLAERYVVPNAIVNNQAITIFPPVQTIDIPFLTPQIDDAEEFACQLVQAAKPAIASVAEIVEPGAKVFYQGGALGGYAGVVRASIIRGSATTGVVVDAVARAILPYTQSSPAAPTEKADG